MIILFLILIPLFYLIIKFILYFIVAKFGKFSYDGFSAAGFRYNSEKDIFYGTRNAWQKKFGYSHIYDVGAPLFRMIIDTEPIRFYYNNKNWLLTFWKGQYGIVTGAEIGIYATTQQKVNKKTIYLPVEDNEMLDMSFILYKNGKELTRVRAKHWWLAIFKLGMFSKPKELSMDIKITFPNKDMLEAFFNSFKKLKHSSKEYKIVDNIFYFTYKKPRTHKVWTRFWLSDSINQFLNHKNVKLYNKYLEDVIDNDKIDNSKVNKKQLIIINEYVPDILKNDIKVKKLTKNNKIGIFFDDKVYSGLKQNNDKKIK